MVVRFSPGSHNAKLRKLEKRLGAKVYSFSLLSGHSCPYAKDCHSKAVQTEQGAWRIQDGEHTQFRCFSASQDVLFPALRRQRQANMEIVELSAKSIVDAAAVISEAMPLDADIIRIHVGGDFKTQAYFDTWLEVARSNPLITFYAYTKSLPFWVKRIGEIPPNFHLTASYGGYRDDLISQYNLRSATVVLYKTIKQAIAAGDPNAPSAESLRLTIDYDDSHAAQIGPSFALLIHGAQPKGSKAGKAVWKQRKQRRKVVSQ